jgi:predicted ATPase/DNA-binding XRE family transcriptional regulator
VKLDNPSAFGNWLKQQRKALKLRQEDLARFANCSLITIQKIEAGERRPSRQIAQLLAQALKIPSDEHPEFIRFARAELDLASLDPANPKPWREFHYQLTNLPILPHSLFGREESEAKLRELLLQEQVQLVTLIGTPGIGKTSLAIQVAGNLLDAFDDGVFFVDLSSARAANEVMIILTQTFGLKVNQEQSRLETLQKYLQTRRLLLVLDNFEQVLEVASQLASLINGCRWLKILVTSRSALRLRQERRFELLPLELPPLTDKLSLTEIKASPAVALFVERAQAIRSEFKLSKDNMSNIAQTCIQLEGLPLAIELAAARVNLLSPKEISQRVSNRLALLQREAPDLPARHQTLREAIAWSYELLNGFEQRLFRRMGVFTGGCTLQAIIEVCLPEINKEEIEKHLERLVDQSLLQRNEGFKQTPRFAMLETLREFALEQLGQIGEQAELEERHCAWFLKLAEEAEPYLSGSEQVGWLDRLQVEHANFQQALNWALSGDKAITTRQSLIGINLATSLYPYWDRRSYFISGRNWLELAYQRIQELRTFEPTLRSLEAKLILCIAELALRQNDFQATNQLGKNALELSEELNEISGKARAELLLGAVQQGQGDLKRAKQHYAQSLTYYRQINEKWGSGLALLNLGIITILEQDLVGAKNLLEESLELNRQAGDLRNIARTLYVSSTLSIISGGNALQETLNLKQSLKLFEQLGDTYLVCQTLEILGWAYGRASQFDKATRILAAVEKFREDYNIPLSAALLPIYEPFIKGLCNQLGQATFELNWAEGKAMTLQQTLALAQN